MSLRTRNCNWALIPHVALQKAPQPLCMWLPILCLHSPWQASPQVTGHIPGGMVGPGTGQGVSPWFIRVHGQAQAMMQLETGMLLLRQGLRWAGDVGEGSRWDWSGPTRSLSDLRAWHIPHLLCLNTSLFGDSLSCRLHWQKVQLCKREFPMTVFMLYPNIQTLKSDTKMCWMLQLWKYTWSDMVWVKEM